MARLILFNNKNIIISIIINLIEDYLKKLQVFLKDNMNYLNAIHVVDKSPLKIFINENLKMIKIDCRFDLSLIILILDKYD